MALISIIVPVYNTGRYLEKSLTSICNQSIDDIEIICIDDGSTDNSAEILKKIKNKDKRLTIITQENKGLGAARNAGIKKAKGKYIGFIDSDDTIDIDFYQKLFNAAEKTESDIVYAPFRYIFPDKTFNEEVRLGEYTSLKEKYNVLNNGGVTNKLFKRNLIQNIVFPVGKIYEDNLFLIKAVCKAKKLCIIDNCHYNYFIKENSLTTDKANKKKRDSDSLFIAKEIFAYALPKLISKEEKFELIDFVVRSFVYKNRLQNSRYVKSFANMLKDYKEAADIFIQIAKFNRLSFWDRIFSIKEYRNIRTFRILGFKIKKKIKES